MVCYHPLKGFNVAPSDSSKKKMIICSQDVQSVQYYGGFWHRDTLNVVSPMAEKVIYDSIDIPCGKCIGCRLDYSRQWADRCLLESTYYDSNYFVTLTYDDKHLPLNYYLTEDGEEGVSATLVKKDLQDFNKRLRKWQDKEFSNKIRFYGCGEYGGQTHRPHYHVIYFGLILNDLVFYKRSSLGFDLYNSQSLTDIWDAGHVVVASVNWKTCAYVSRYVTKKLNGSYSAEYETFNFIPEFSVMSRRPGIGRQYYEDNKEHLFNTNFVSVPTLEGEKRIYPPNYFIDLLEDDDLELYTSLKEKRSSRAESLSSLKLSLTDNDNLGMLESEEVVKLQKLKTLKRSDCSWQGGK